MYIKKYKVERLISGFQKYGYMSINKFRCVNKVECGYLFARTSLAYNNKLLWSLYCVQRNGELIGKWFSFGRIAGGKMKCLFPKPVWHIFTNGQSHARFKFWTQWSVEVRFSTDVTRPSRFATDGTNPSRLSFLSPHWISNVRVIISSASSISFAISSTSHNFQNFFVGILHNRYFLGY
jgi:hypothetical protein